MTAAPASPQLAASLGELVDPTLEDELEWFDVEVTGELTGPDEIRDADVNGCRITGLTFGPRVFHRLRMTDCVLVGCDLSGVTFVDSSLIRVQLESCRLTGAIVSGVRAQDVAVTDSRADQAVMRMSAWKSSRFTNTDLRQLDAYDADLTAAVFEACELTGADFSAAKLEGARLHGSTLEGVRGGTALRGVQISGHQVLPLALSIFTALDITVDDGPR